MLKSGNLWGEEIASLSLLVPAVVAHPSLRQAAGTNAVFSVEAFGAMKITVYAAPWKLGCSAHSGIEGNEGSQLWGLIGIRITGNRSKSTELTYCLHCWSKLGNTFVNKKTQGFGS